MFLSLFFIEAGWFWQRLRKKRSPNVKKSQQNNFLELSGPAVRWRQW